MTAQRKRKTVAQVRAEAAADTLARLYVEYHKLDCNASLYACACEAFGVDETDEAYVEAQKRLGIHPSQLE
jgi:hypothetical protein